MCMKICICNAKRPKRNIECSRYRHYHCHCHRRHCHRRRRNNNKRQQSVHMHTHSKINIQIGQIEEYAHIQAAKPANNRINKRDLHMCAHVYTCTHILSRRTLTNKMCNLILYSHKLINTQQYIMMMMMMITIILFVFFFILFHYNMRNVAHENVHRNKKITAITINKQKKIDIKSEN